jgi:hypothetical protein
VAVIEAEDPGARAGILPACEQLLAHAYADHDAWTIARDTSIDLELARRLVAKLGCPSSSQSRSWSEEQSNGSR